LLEKKSLEALDIDQGAEAVHDVDEVLLVGHHLIQVFVGLRGFIPELGVRVAHNAFHGLNE
jgi:hypothetical protein